MLHLSVVYRKEIGCCSLPDHARYGPEADQTALLLKKWVLLAPNKMKNEYSSPSPPLGEGMVCSPPRSEQLPPSLGHPSQGRLDRHFEGLVAA